MLQAFIWSVVCTIGTKNNLNMNLTTCYIKQIFLGLIEDDNNHQFANLTKIRKYEDNKMGRLPLK